MREAGVVSLTSARIYDDNTRDLSEMLSVYWGYSFIRRQLEMRKLRRRIWQQGVSAVDSSSEICVSFRDLAVAAALDPAKIYILIVPSPMIGAASLGQGTFVVCEPLVTLGNPCLLWGIIAHEIAHDSLGHSDAAIRAADVRDVIGMITGGLPILPFHSLVLKAFDRSQERAADARAVLLLEAAGRPRWELRYALEFLQDAYGESGGWLSTHPMTSERIAAQPEIEQTMADARVTKKERERQVLYVKRLMSEREGQEP